MLGEFIGMIIYTVGVICAFNSENKEFWFPLVFFIPVLIVYQVSGGHLNPAVTFGIIL